MIRKGTTPTHIFSVDIDLSQAVVLYITYKQNNKTIIEKTLDDCEITQTEVAVKLTQSESLKFEMVSPIEIQIRAKFVDGTAVASNIIRTYAGEILKGGEI